LAAGVKNHAEQLVVRHQSQTMADLNHLATRFRLDLLDTAALVRVAEQLLEEERDTPAVIGLLTLENPIFADAAQLFEKLCLEQGIVIPTKDEAIINLLRLQLDSIASGAIVPHEGLAAMMREIYFPYFAGEPCKKYVGDSRGLEHLVGAFWNYDDLIEHPNRVSWDGKYGTAAITAWEASVRQYARDWITKHNRVAGS
jgi:hypothetical protein